MDSSPKPRATSIFGVVVCRHLFIGLIGAPQSETPGPPKPQPGLKGVRDLLVDGAASNAVMNRRLFLLYSELASELQASWGFNTVLKMIAMPAWGPMGLGMMAYVLNVNAKNSERSLLAICVRGFEVCRCNCCLALEPKSSKQGRSLRPCILTQYGFERAQNDFKHGLWPP